MLDFPIFDSDNHYYEATDAFTRHIDPSMRSRAMQWAEINGKQRLLVGGKVNRFIPNPTFSEIAKPGVLTDYFRAKSGGSDLRARLAELEPIEERPEYRDRDARVEVMDRQGIESTLMLPTLGVGMEAALEHDPQALTAAFSAFNRWLLDDWGFNYKDRIYAVPYITLVDPEWAVEELEFALANDARVVVMRPGPVKVPNGYARPSDPRHDAFWARLNESGITLALHGGDSSYGDYDRLWGMSGTLSSMHVDPLKLMLSANPTYDMFASMMVDRLFERFPNLRVASIENGSSWVGPLLKQLKITSIRRPGVLDKDPYELFLQHVWVSPYFEDDIYGLVKRIGASHVLFGSDFPHVEGLAEPASFVKEVDQLPEADIRLIMRDNARELVTPRVG